MNLLLLCEACQPKRLEVKTMCVDPATCDGCGRETRCDKVAVSALLECVRNATAGDGAIVKAYEAEGDGPIREIAAKVHKVPLILSAIDRDQGWFTFAAYSESRDKALAHLEIGQDHELEVLEPVELFGVARA